MRAVRTEAGMMCVYEQQLTLTPERQEENANHMQGPEGMPRSSIHKLWALEKAKLPLWGCFPCSQNKGASPQKPMRVPSQPTKTPPGGWEAAVSQGLGAGAGEGAVQQLSGGPGVLLPSGQGAQDTGGTRRAPTPLSSQLFGQQSSQWPPAGGPPSHAERRPETSPRAPQLSTSAKQVSTLAVSTWPGLTTCLQLCHSPHMDPQPKGPKRRWESVMPTRHRREARAETGPAQPHGGGGRTRPKPGRQAQSQGL